MDEWGTRGKKAPRVTSIDEALPVAAGLAAGGKLLLKGLTSTAAKRALTGAAARFVAGSSSGSTPQKSKKKEEVKEAAWTKKEGQNKSGGLNEKGRKSYERENPGSDLKAPSKKVGNKRRASFCARMKGMRKRQKPSNNTGDDRLSKSLRAWNC